MPTTVEIKKGNGIEGLFSGNIPAKPEEEKQIDVAEGGIQELILQYEQFLERRPNDSDRVGDTFKATEFVTGVFAPEVINAFLQMTVRYEDHRNYRISTGSFISRLVQNSYDAGHNDFVLNTTALRRMDNLCSCLEGKKENSVRVAIEGNVRDVCGALMVNSILSIKGYVESYCGLESRDSVFNIEGNVYKGCGTRSERSTFNISRENKTAFVGDWCGDHSKESIFNIQGEVAHNCGIDSEKSTFNIQGSTEMNCGNRSKYSIFNIENSTEIDCGHGSEKSIFNIKGNAGNECGCYSKGSTFVVHGYVGEKCGVKAEGSIFKTLNRKTMVKRFKQIPEGNRLVLIHPDGREQVIRDFHYF